MVGLDGVYASFAAIDFSPKAAYDGLCFCGCIHQADGKPKEQHAFWVVRGMPYMAFGVGFP